VEFEVEMELSFTVKVKATVRLPRPAGWYTTGDPGDPGEVDLHTLVPKGGTWLDALADESRAYATSHIAATAEDATGGEL
jgi:hypothetical protein